MCRFPDVWLKRKLVDPENCLVLDWPSFPTAFRAAHASTPIRRASGLLRAVISPQEHYANNSCWRLSKDTEPPPAGEAKSGD